MKLSQKPLHLPLLTPALPLQNLTKTHKTSKSISFPMISPITENRTLETTAQSITNNEKNTNMTASQPNLIKTESETSGTLLKKANKMRKNDETSQNITKTSKKNIKKPNMYKSPLKRLMNYLDKDVNKSTKTKQKNQETSVEYSNLLSQREIMLYWSQKRYSKRILEQLMENLHLAYELNSFKLLTDTIYLIGDLHLCDGNVDSALYAYYQMKILCDLTQNFKMKLFSLLALANCCKILKNNTQALFLYKKALEYVWLLRDEETEAKIYDRIGMIYFHFGEIRKARYYHDRSLEYKLESDISPSKYSSAKALEKYHDSLKSLHFEGLTTILLGKIGISFQNSEEILRKNSIEGEEHASFSPIQLKQEENSAGVQQNRKKVKFGSNLTVEALLENIFYEKDLNYEIPSPRYPRGYSEEDILLGRVDVVGRSKRPKDKENDRNSSDSISFSINQLNLLNINSQKFRKPVVKIDLDPMQMKIPINEKIKLRNQIVRHIKNKETIFGNKLNSKQKIKPAELLGFGIYFNHMTPNRNLEAFNYFYKNKGSKLNKYYENLVKIEEKNTDQQENQLVDFDFPVE